MTACALALCTCTARFKMHYLPLTACSVLLTPRSQSRETEDYSYARCDGGLLHKQSTQVHSPSRIGLNLQQRMLIVTPVVAFNILQVEVKVISALA